MTDLNLCDTQYWNEHDKAQKLIERKAAMFDEQRLILLQIAVALFMVLDGEKDHDIQSMTGYDADDVKKIIEARKVAEAIVEKAKEVK